MWHASYKGWGELQGEHNLKGVHQPLRLQNQYFDKETGLHYNFFRYYEPITGRFTTQDPIGLAGGENLYRFEATIQNAIDPLGWAIPIPIFYGGLAIATSIGLIGTQQALENSSTTNTKDRAQPIAAKSIAVSECSDKERKKRCKKWGVGTPKDAQRKISRGQGSKNISMIHEPDEKNVPGPQWHAHDFGNEALNLDGSLHHRNFPNFSKDDKDFLFCHGWNI
nr:RHS repeat-associated core domain-containing protein [Muribacter muris]